MKYVIVGNGVAGVTAAQSIARADAAADVHVFGAEPHLYYRRPLLWEFIAGEMEQDELGYSPQTWHKMADLGWLKLPFSPEYGGEGMGFLELALIVEQMGAVLLPAPFISTVIGGLAIMEFGRKEQKEALLPAIGLGELILSLAVYEPDLKLAEDSIAARAEVSGDGFLLFGDRPSGP